MFRHKLLHFFCFTFLFPFYLFAVDFDCIIVGSSPFSLFEALYQSYSGKKVLILEESARCGGAWKGIDICGIKHVDLGCHQIGRNLQLKEFLEQYVGCKIISMDHPFSPFESSKSPNGWYFSKGCYELIENLLRLVAQTDIVLLNENKVEGVFVDLVQKTASVQTKDKTFTTPHLILTPASYINLNQSPLASNRPRIKYYHLYLLIQDPNPPQFTYKSGLIQGVSRVMNLSYFAELINTGRQLIVLQVHQEQSLSNGPVFLEALKTQKLLDPAAYILKAESYIYEVGFLNQGLISKMGAQGIIEILQTNHFQNLANYIPKWKQAFKNLSE